MTSAGLQLAIGMYGRTLIAYDQPYMSTKASLENAKSALSAIYKHL